MARLFCSMPSRALEIPSSLRAMRRFWRRGVRTSSSKFNGRWCDYCHACKGSLPCSRERRRCRTTISTVRCSACHWLAAPTLETIPADHAYIAPADAAISFWRTRLPQRRLRVGLVWSGERSHDNDLNRSMRLATLEPLLDLPDVAFVSLQHEVREEDLPFLQSRSDVCEIGRQFKDFADTAAAIALLDAVIAVDTAVAHLAGAMGKPLFLLLPFAADFRWLRERADSPWYPSARLFRQPQFGDWEAS